MNSIHDLEERVIAAAEAWVDAQKGSPVTREGRAIAEAVFSLRYHGVVFQPIEEEVA